MAGRHPLDHPGDVVTAATTTAQATAEWTPDEMMAIAAARTLRNGDSCFVGVGIPSTAAILALRTTAPDLILIYESGAIGARPNAIPLSIGDGDLASTALSVVSMTEMFNYWLQPGRIGVGFLGAAQVDRLGNLNTTVIGGEYAHPRVRLPGAGGAPEIAAACREVTIICRHDVRAFVPKVDFVTTVGHGDGPGDRQRLGFAGAGPTRVITDLGVLEPNPATCELELRHLHPHSTVEEAVAATGWPLRVHPDLTVLPEPTAAELSALRALTAAGHA